MRSLAQGQLLLFPGAGAPRRQARAGGPRPRRADRRARMAERLDELAALAEREAAECRRAHDMVGARAARDRALGARRAAELLRAGPAGVAEVMGGGQAA
jgi:hypothetical protein